MGKRSGTDLECEHTETDSGPWWVGTNPEVRGRADPGPVGDPPVTLSGPSVRWTPSRWDSRGFRTPCLGSVTLVGPYTGLSSTEKSVHVWVDRPREGWVDLG